MLNCLRTMRRRTPLLRLVLLPASLVVAASSSARAQTSGPTYAPPSEAAGMLFAPDGSALVAWGP